MKTCRFTRDNADRRGVANCVADYSDCKLYRYRLRIVWDESLPVLMFLMLNPSTATERENDRTVNRCEKYARAGRCFGTLCVTNLFAFRTPHPSVLKEADEPIGTENNRIIREEACLARKIICAWGNDCKIRNRGDNVLNRDNNVMTMLRQETDTPLHCLALNASGHPKHPLFARAPWNCIILPLA